MTGFNAWFSFTHVAARKCSRPFCSRCSVGLGHCETRVVGAPGEKKPVQRRRRYRCRRRHRHKRVNEHARTRFMMYPAGVSVFLLHVKHYL